MKTIELYGDGIGRVEYIQHYGSDKMIVNAARVSFGKDSDTPLDERDEKLIKYLVAHKHTSTLEHCGITFKFVVPMFVCAQHMRHRTWAYNQISRRYTSENLQFFVPQSLRKQHEKNRQASEGELAWSDQTNLKNEIYSHHLSCWNLYEKLLEQGVCREQARGVLPQNLYTEYYGTVNLNNLMRFIKLRDSEHAQEEIRVVAQACRAMATELFSVAMSTLSI